ALREDFWEAINNIGLVQYEQGNLNAASENWTKAVEINDKVAEPQLAIAVATYQKGDRNLAIEQAEAALRLDGRYGDLDFLADQLWGERILKDAAPLLAQPRVQIAAQRALESVQNQQFR
ncbi:MAG: cytochrome c biogenesis factor, partial [Prochlorotrichaceae cyanobacterium]